MDKNEKVGNFKSVLKVAPQLCHSQRNAFTLSAELLAIQNAVLVKA